MTYAAQLPPLPAEAVATAGVGFADLFCVDGDVYWVEQRPQEDGRNVLVVADGAGISGLTAPGLSVGSRAYEYGGGAAEVADGVVFFVAKANQRIYRQVDRAEPQSITPADGRRYGGLCADLVGQRLLAVCEDHRGADALPQVTIVAVPLTGGEPEILVSGRDFYGPPRVSPDGTELAYLAWDFPNMPWDDTELFTAPVDDLASARLVAGGPGESVCHPVWSPDGVLHYLSDRTGWWNIYAESGPLAPMAAEQGTPGALGRAPYDVSADAVVFAARVDGDSRLLTVDRATSALSTVDTLGRDPAMPRFAGDALVYLAGSSTELTGVWRRHAGADPEQLQSAGAGSIDTGYLEPPELLEVPTRDGGTVHAFYYRPLGARVPAPLVVMAHGGPVSATSAALRPGTGMPQFWTSRGYGVVDVNYRGSTGYGRAYRQALYGRWGELEVDDCIDAADLLVARGDADRARVVIRGGSAGGFTTLAALAFRDYFAAGTAYFPVSDLVAFHGTTHKFEARYDEKLIGPWDPAEYRRRSPIDRVADITVPLLLVQGLQDKVCPPEQSERVVDALTALGRDVEYVTFADEAHGFTRADSICRSLDAEAAFYKRVLARS